MGAHSLESLLTQPRYLQNLLIEITLPLSCLQQNARHSDSGWLTHATRLPPFLEDPTQAATELNVAIENAVLLDPNNLFGLTTVTSTPLAQNHRRATDTIFLAWPGYQTSSIS